MDKRAEFSAALKVALKNKDKVALATIRLIMASLKDRDIAAREKGEASGLDENTILSMLQSMIKQRHESSKTYKGKIRRSNRYGQSWWICESKICLIICK